MSKTPIRQLPISIFVTLVLISIFIAFNYKTQIDYYTAIYEIKINGNYANAYSKYLKEATDSNAAKTQYILGTIYEEGEFLSQDFEKAYKWYKRAASQNLPEAILKIEYFDKHNISEIKSPPKIDDEKQEEFKIIEEVKKAKEENKNEQENIIDKNDSFVTPPQIINEKEAVKNDTKETNLIPCGKEESSILFKSQVQDSSEKNNAEPAVATACPVTDLLPL